MSHKEYVAEEYCYEFVNTTYSVFTFPKMSGKSVLKKKIY